MLNLKQFYTLAKTDPTLALSLVIKELEQSTNERVKIAVDKAIEEVKDSTNKEIQKIKNDYVTKVAEIKKEYTEKVVEIHKDVPKIKESLSSQMTKWLRAKADSIPHIKGDKGDKGDSIKGDPGEPGKPGVTPRAGKDYMTFAQATRMITSLVKEVVPSKKELKLMMEGFVRELMPKPAELARMIESLRNTPEALDYEVLKNKPGIKTYEEKQGGRVIRRGGGVEQQVKFYDLSDETDGTTKVFTIPTNKRVLGVFSTQFPINYRPQIDWTSTATQLTLTDEVAAPEQGQTLYIMYVSL